MRKVGNDARCLARSWYVLLQVSSKFFFFFLIEGLNEMLWFSEFHSVKIGCEMNIKSQKENITIILPFHERITDQHYELDKPFSTRYYV